MNRSSTPPPATKPRSNTTVAVNHDLSLPMYPLVASDTISTRPRARSSSLSTGRDRSNSTSEVQVTGSKTGKVREKQRNWHAFIMIFLFESHFIMPKKNLFEIYKLIQIAFVAQIFGKIKILFFFAVRTEEDENSPHWKRVQYYRWNAL